MCIRLAVLAELGYWATLKGEPRREKVLANSSFCCAGLEYFRNHWITSDIMKLPWAFSILLTTPPTLPRCFLYGNCICVGVWRKENSSIAFCLSHSPCGASLKFKCVWVCTQSQVSPQDPVESPPTQRVMNVGPLRQPLRVSHYGSVLSQPSLPVSPHSMADPTECTKLALLWLIELPACPPPAHSPIKQFHIIKCDDPLF